MKVRNDFIQLVRGICIICVVIIHTIGLQENEVNNYFTIMIRTLVNFAVAIFLVISAYLTNIKKVEEHPREYIIKRVKRLFFPFIIWSVIYTIILRKFNFSGLENFLKTIVSVFLGTNAAQLYYIVLLLIFNLLTPLLIKVIKSKNKVVNVILILITPVYLIINFLVNEYGGINIPYSNNMPFGWLLYYYIGLYLNIKKNSKLESLATVHTRARIF